MKLAASAASAVVLSLLLAGCGGSGNTADYKACKAMIKADMAKSRSAVRSGQLPTNLPTAMAAECSRLSQADMARLLNEVANELKNSPPVAASNPATAASRAHFPARLFNLPKNTSSHARTVIRKDTGWLAADQQHFRLPWGAYYGSNPGPVIDVFGAMFTAPVALTAQLDPGFDRRFATSATKSWGNGLRPFPAGAHGGALYCVHEISRPGMACLWADQVGVGEVGYFGGSASTLSDAAAKTNQIRAIIEP
jgi:hypothetical protein